MTAAFDREVPTREYHRDGVTVQWFADLCEHCELCHKGLPGVFNPEARPWVNMQGATIEEITAQVDKCPSLALRWKQET